MGDFYAINILILFPYLPHEISYSSYNFIAIISERWNDERYSWKPSDYEGLTSIPLPFSKSWAPDLVLVNAAEDKFVYRQVGVVKSNGDIVYVVGVHTKSNCAPNYDKHPFGIQTCQVSLNSNRDYI